MWHGTVSEFQGRTSTTAQTKKLADELDHSAKESGQSTSESETKSWESFVLRNENDRGGEQKARYQEED